MFFNAGREVGPVFESKNIMVDWCIFLLVHLTCRISVNVSLCDDLSRTEVTKEADFDLRHLTI